MKRSAPNQGMRHRHPRWLQGLCSGALMVLACWADPAQSLAQPLCSAPRITNQPVSLIVLAGEPATFSVGVYDEICALSYRWRDFDANILGGTSASWTINNVQPNRVGLFSVVVTNISGSVTSSFATLTVVSGPEPSRASVEPGADVTFRIPVTGTGWPISYQWQFNGEDLPGATNSTLTLAQVQTSQGGAYAVTVSNPAGSVTSADAILTVGAAPRLSCLLSGANGFRFQVTGSADVTYVIQFSEDLSEWIDISTNTAPASGTFDFIDPNPSASSGRFYRALQP